MLLHTVVERDKENIVAAPEDPRASSTFSLLWSLLGVALGGGPLEGALEGGLTSLEKNCGHFFTFVVTFWVLHLGAEVGLYGHLTSH